MGTRVRAGARDQPGRAKRTGEERNPAARASGSGGRKSAPSSTDSRTPDPQPPGSARPMARTGSSAGSDRPRRDPQTPGPLSPAATKSGPRAASSLGSSADRLGRPERGAATVGAARPGRAKLSTAERFAQRTRQARRRRLRRLLLGAAVAALVPGLAALLVLGPVCTVRTVEIRGASPAVAEQFAVRAESVRGRPLATLSTATLRADLGRPSAVKDLRIERRWPSTLRVTVTMRSAIAALPGPGGFRLVDDTGQHFATVKSAPRGLPQVTAPAGATGWPAVAAAVQVFAALPPKLQSELRNLQARSADDVRFTWGSSVVRWGNAQQSSTKLAVLTALRSTKAREYDLSAPQTPVVR
ncbi:MAG: cell division protein FtsQ/DivIB [Angustibacter sp.]